MSTTPHPELAGLLAKLPPGRYAGGLLMVSTPGAIDDAMGDWLLGKVAGRLSLGRSVFGDILMFRDLRARARETGTGDPETECDVALIDIHYKKMDVLAYSVPELFELLDDEAFQETFLRKHLVNIVRPRLGDPNDDECYAFLPALALGGSEDPASVRRLNWFVQQAILIQT